MNPEEWVSAIVVNHNGRGYVEDAVESLLAQDWPHLEIAVVDNGSSDGSDDTLERRFGARIRLIRVGRNLGFGGGNNRGIRETHGRYVVLLNNDAVVEPSFVREMVAAARPPGIGMVAAKVLDSTSRDRFDTLGHLLYPDGLNRGRGRREHDRGQYDHCATALFPSGAAALYRRDMLDEIGLFDESFFLYGDDAELGLRGRLAGWGCALAPRAICYHHYSRTAGAYSPLKAFYVERNRVWVLIKLFPFCLIVLSPLFTIVRLSLQAWAAFTGRGAAGRLAKELSMGGAVALVVRAYTAAALGAGRMLRERWRARPSRRLSTWQFMKLLYEFPLTPLEVALKD